MCDGFECTAVAVNCDDPRGWDGGQEFSVGCAVFRVAPLPGHYWSCACSGYEDASAVGEVGPVNEDLIMDLACARWRGDWDIPAPCAVAAEGASCCGGVTVPLGALVFDPW